MKAKKGGGMKRYRLLIREVYHTGYSVMAKTAEEARTRYLAGEADPIDNDLEFSHIGDNPIVSVEEE